MLSHHTLIKMLCVSLVVLTQTKIAYACLFHGDFGNSPWASFEPRSTNTPQSYPSAKQSNNESNIKLSLPAMIRAKVKQEEPLTVSYRYTSEGEDPTIQLLVDINSGIAVANNKIDLVGKSGQHTFMLQPQASGTYRLTVTARNANSQSAPLRETVYVNIYD